MSYWYQKEYPAGELFEAFGDISVILGEVIFSCAGVGLREEEKKDDVLVLVTVLRRLSSFLVKSSADSLMINGGRFTRFTWKHGIESDEAYCMCRKVTTGWLFQVGGSDDFGIAVNFGWRKLSDEHPLGHSSVIGPSRHPNFCRNYQT